MTGQPQPLNEVLDAYRSALAENGLAAATIKRRAYDVERFLEAARIGVADVQVHDVVSWLSNPDWKPNTKNSFQASMRLFFRWAKAEGHTQRDPAAKLAKVTIPDDPSSAATQEAIRQALANAPERERMMIKLAYVLGLRTMEIAQVHPRDLRTDDRGRTELRARTTSGKRTRIVKNVPTGLADEIRAHSPNYVFPGQHRGHISPAYVSRLIQAAMPNGERAEQVRAAFKEAQARAASVEGWIEVAPIHTTTNLDLLADPELLGSADLRDSLDRIRRDMETRPKSAIAACKHTLESLCKLILADLEHPASEKEDLPELWRSVSTHLGINAELLPDSKGGSDAVRKLFRTLTTQVQTVAEMRNSISDDHGKFKATNIDSRFSRLAFNATVTVAEFLVTTWQRSKPER